MTESTENGPGKGKTIALWVVTVVAAALMTLAGSSKFTAAEMWAGLFTDWGYPIWFKNLIGVAEVTGALLLLVPRFATYAGTLVALIMLGAVYTVVANESDLGVTAAAINLVLFAGIALARRGDRWMPGR